MLDDENREFLERYAGVRCFFCTEAERLAQEGMADEYKKPDLKDYLALFFSELFMSKVVARKGVKSHGGILPISARDLYVEVYETLIAFRALSQAFANEKNFGERVMKVTDHLGVLPSDCAVKIISFATAPLDPAVEVEIEKILTLNCTKKGENRCKRKTY